MIPTSILIWRCRNEAGSFLTSETMVKGQVCGKESETGESLWMRLHPEQRAKVAVHVFVAACLESGISGLEWNTGGNKLCPQR